MPTIAKSLKAASVKRGPVLPEVTAELISQGQSLNRTLDRIEATKAEAHEAAKALKAALCPKGIVKGSDGKYLPHIADWLKGVFAGDNRKPGTVKVAMSRLVQVIASTTAEKLGTTNDAKTKAKLSRKPRPTAGNTDDNTDNAGNTDDAGNDPSKSAERRSAILEIVKRMEQQLQSLELGSLSRLTNEARKGARAQCDELRQSLKAIRALIG